MRVTRVAAVGLFTALVVAILACSFASLAKAPTVGMEAAWDPDAVAWRVTAADPSGPFVAGDAVLRIGDVPVGRLHLARNTDVRTAGEVREFLEAKRALAGALAAPEVDVEVVRGGKAVLLRVRPHEGGGVFLAHSASLCFLVGLAFFLVGSVVLYRKGLRDEHARVLSFHCMVSTLACFSIATTTIAPLVFEPWYFEAVNLVGLACFLLAPAILLHFSLLVPRRRAFLERAPWVLLPYYAGCAAVIVLLRIDVVNVCAPLFFLLSVAVAVQGLLACRGPVERQQMKWVVAGFGFGVVPWLAINGLPLMVGGERLMPDPIPGAAMFLVPVSLAFAIQKYRLLDIDGFLRGTFVYVLTVGVLVLVDLGFVAVLGSGVGRSLGFGDAGRSVAVLVLTALLYAPVRDGVRRAALRVLGREAPTRSRR